MARGQNREKLCECGFALLGQQGFAATGIQEIADAAGVPKGSFYNYFESKDEFALEALERYLEMRCALLEDTLVRGKGTPLERLRASSEEWIAMCESGEMSCGCLAGNLAQELAQHNVRFRDVIENGFQRVQKLYENCIAEAQDAGQISGEIPAEKLASFAMNAAQGAMMRMKTTGDLTPLREFEEMFFHLVLRVKQ